MYVNNENKDKLQDKPFIFTILTSDYKQQLLIHDFSPFSKELAENQASCII